MSLKITKSNRKKRWNRKGRRGAGYWVVAVGTFGAIVAFTIGSSHRVTLAHSGEAFRKISTLKIVEIDSATIDFSIGAADLATVIEAFRKKTGIQIIADNAAIMTIASQGVTGSFTTEQALKEILKGTGVSFVFRDPRTVILSLKAESATVEIRDTGVGIVSSPKYSEPLRDTPQTISVIPEDVIRQQGATTLRDVLNNVPGITLTAGEGGAPAGDNMTIRGFSARNDIYIDGVRDLGAQSRDSFNLEQVEVVKGPSSTFTGRGSTGGTINLVSKLPNLRRSFAGTLTAGNANTKRATVDGNLPLSDTIALRVNALGHDSDFPGREVVQNRRWGFAPSIIFGMGTNTRYSVSYFYIEQDNTSDYGIPWVPATNTVLVDFRDRIAPVPRSTFYGLIDRDKEKLRSDLITGRVEHEFNDKMAIRNQFRYGYSRRDSIATPPRFANNNSTTINRDLRSFLAIDDIFDNQTDLTGKFKTGSIEHSAVFGGSYSYEKTDRGFRSGTGATPDLRLTPTTLFDPNPRDVYAGSYIVSPLRGDVTAKTLAAYFFDTIRFNKQWEFVGGLRWDRFDVEGVNVNTTPNPDVFVPLARVDKILSGRASLIFKPVENGSIYASYGTSANPSLEGLLYQPVDVRTDPEKTRTLEVGTKWDLFGNKLLLSGALFRVEKTDARSPTLFPGEPLTLDGDQRVQGIEISATGNITRNWQIFSGYTYLDSEILATNTPAEFGKELLNTPRNSFNLWTTYAWDKFFFGGGARYVGKRFGNNTNTRVVDDYVVVDAVVSYKLTKNIDLRLNLNNISDKFYIDRIGGGHVIPGAGRTILVSSGFNF